MNLTLTEAKTAFRTWWIVMSEMSAKYGDPEGVNMKALPEYPEMDHALTQMLTELSLATGFCEGILRNTVIMAMSKVMDTHDMERSGLTETHLDQILELTLGYTAATTARLRFNQGQLAN